MRTLATILLAATLSLLIGKNTSSAAVAPDTSVLRQAVTVGGIRAHQAALQAVADANSGTRASGTPGYDASADYVVNTLVTAGYVVSVQPFDYPFFRELSPPRMERVLPNPFPYIPNVDFFTMDYSGSGDVTAPLGVVANYGCDASDFSGFIAGSVALIERGVCYFYDKAVNAVAAGAVGVIIFNDAVRETPFRGTLMQPAVGIPVVGTSHTIGQDLASAESVRLMVDATSGTATTSNIIAETSGGRGDRVVVVGAHLDSVFQGPGIHDNGSGVAAILEIAVQMAELSIEPRNRVRFAFWGAKEDALEGSRFYVGNLTKRERKNIALYLNFDAIGSPNFVRFVYDGDGSNTGLSGPHGSGNVEQIFLKYFAEQGLIVEPLVLDYASDLASFAGVGVPVGGIFSGSTGIKTEAQAAIYGGTAGEQYDPCYHLACDTFDNISLTALDEMSDAAAHTVLTFAMTTSSVQGTGRAAQVATVVLANH